MNKKSYITCPDGHFSEGDTCTTCGFKSGEVISSFDEAFTTDLETDALGLDPSSFIYG